MSTGNLGPPEKTPPIIEAFSQQVRTALEHYDDPAWLGQNSPLAKPYFLGEFLLQQGEINAEGAAGRGQVLQKLLHETAEGIAAEDMAGEKTGRLLQIRFIRPRAAEKVRAALKLGAAEYEQAEGHAIRLVETKLIERLRPALRLELPYLGHTIDQTENDVKKDLYEAYKAGLIQLLSRMDKKHADYEDAQTLEQRLLDNIYPAQQHGDAEISRRERSQILAALNKLADKHLQIPFSELCGLITYVGKQELISTLFGRDETVAGCLRALDVNQTVALVGPGGVGKTRLGKHLADQLFPQPAFWYTFRPGLNDSLGSLLFSLGYFLQKLGAPGLWLQLNAEDGRVEPAVALSLIRYALADMSYKPPLLCFDEIGLLQPDEVEAHAHLLAFIRDLQGETPILLIGQQVSLKVDQRYELAGLDALEIEDLLVEAKIELSLDDIALLHHYTEGNPRLLELFITLHQVGEALTDILPHLADTPSQVGTLSIETLLRRIWERLTQTERDLLMTLAVFLPPAPKDAWSSEGEQAALEQLIERRLVQMDAQGGAVLLQPAFSQGISALIAPEERELAHLKAANVRAVYGEYTAVAYHCLEGGQAALAIRAWYAHRQQEINQGQASTALALFKNLSRTHLQGPDQEVLGLLRGELWKLKGEYNRTQAEMMAIDWQSPLNKARAKRLEGDIAELRGKLDEALEAYQTGLDTVETILESEVAQFHKNLGWAYWRQRNLDKAWREACLVRYEAEKLQGDVQRAQRDFIAAESHYLTALKFAEELGHVHNQAKVRLSLSIMLIQQGKFEEANLHLEKADHIYKQVGSPGSLAGVKINQAMAYNLAGHPQNVIQPAEEALTLFQQLHIVIGQAVAAHNLAEAHFALGHLVEAENFAQQVIQTKEIKALPDALRVLGEVKLAQKDFQAAETFIQQSIDAAEANEDPYLGAYAWRAMGQVHQAQENDAAAQAAWDRAVAMFKEMDLENEVEKTEALRGGNSGPEAEAADEGVVAETAVEDEAAPDKTVSDETATAEAAPDDMAPDEAPDQGDPGD